MARGNDEILGLTGLRAVLAWWVVLFHFGRHLVPTAIARGLAGAGYLAVDVFFVLSGYVLARRYLVVDLGARAARRAFWARRFARVYPLYVASLVVGIGASWPRSWSALTEPREQVALALQIAVLNGWSHVAMFARNWAAWSLSVEAFFYALLPLIFVRLRRLHVAGLAWVLVLSWAATFVAPAVYTAVDPDHLGRSLRLGDEVYWSWYLKFFPVQRLPELVAGAAAGLWRARRGAAPFGRNARAVAVVALVLAAAVLRVPYAYLQAGVLLPLAMIVIASLDGDPLRPATWLSHPWVTALGRASYATYILHVPVFLGFARLFPAAWESGRLVTAYMVVLLFLSVAAHRVLEEPGRRLLTRWLVRRHEHGTT